MIFVFLTLFYLSKRKIDHLAFYECEKRVFEERALVPMCRSSFRLVEDFFAGFFVGYRDEAAS